MIDLPTINATYQSPNFNDRTLPISIVVLHYTAMVPAKPVLDHFQNPQSQVSAHFVIDEDGKTYQMVDYGKRAWHAGISHWGGIQNVNSASIGIELVNPGFGPDYRDYSSPQMQAVQGILGYAVPHYNIMPWNIVAHSDVAPTRKQDPGHRFPWQSLHQAGFGLWPQADNSSMLITQAINTTAFYENLIDYGYTSLALNATDEVKRATTLAFQRHFQPELFTQKTLPVGIPDAVTVYRLENLLQQKKSLLESALTPRSASSSEL